jgi:hypothetical protein
VRTHTDNVFAVATVDGTYCATTRRKKLDDDVGPTVWEVKARELPEWKGTADCSIT